MFHFPLPSFHFLASLLLNPSRHSPFTVFPLRNCFISKWKTLGKWKHIAWWCSDGNINIDLIWFGAFRTTIIEWATIADLLTHNLSEWNKNFHLLLLASPVRHVTHFWFHFATHNRNKNAIRDLPLETGKHSKADLFTLALIDSKRNKKRPKHMIKAHKRPSTKQKAENLFTPRHHSALNHFSDSSFFPHFSLPHFPTFCSLRTSREWRRAKNSNPSPRKFFISCRRRRGKKE